jgi:two-component system NarL family sensor kinase
VQKNLNILNAIAQALNAETRLQKALETALSQVVKWFDLRTAWIWLIHPETEQPYLAAGYQLPPALQERPELLTGTCYCLDAYLNSELDAVSNISEITCTRLKSLVGGTDDLRYHASVPLYARKRKVGLLNVLSQHSQELDEDSLRILQIVGDMVGLAVERAQLFENSRELGKISERNRLAREIHDTLAQGLTAITYKLEALSIKAEKSHDQDDLLALIEQTQSLVKHNLEEARRSVMDLRATPLEGTTLKSALQKLIEETEFPIKLRFKGDPPPMSSRLEMGVYRIVQEAFQNVKKHAEARKTSFLLRFFPAEIQLQIQDDGKGFEPDQVVDGFGLIGMNERTRLLGGTFQIKSEVGKGTNITVHLPVK